MLIYGVAGPEIALKAGLDLAADTTAEPWWTLTAPVDLTASLTIPALKLSSPTLTVYQHSFPLDQALTITTDDLSDAATNTPYTDTLEADGGKTPYSWAVTSGDPPDGLSLDPATGVISGTPTTPGVSTFEVTVTDELGSTNTATYSLTVTGLDHLTLSPASASIASGASQTYTVEGYDASDKDLGPVTDATLSISPDGSCTAYTCTATTAGAHTVTATDGTAQGTALLTVTSAAPVVVRNIRDPASCPSGGCYTQGVSSDGTHVWVTDYRPSVSNTVDEIDAATGGIVDSIPVGNDPIGVSSDGTHVWVANWSDATVSEIDAATGGVINTITVGSASNGCDLPDAISSDGTDVWVALNGGTVIEVDAATGHIINTITVGSCSNEYLSGISSDGTDVWVANYNAGTVSEIDAATGDVINTINVGDDPSAISSDGTHVWVTNAGDGTEIGTVSEIDAATGDVINTITVGSNPHGVSADGTDVWVTNLNSGEVSEIDAATGDVINTIPVGGAGANGPFYVSSDGTHVWVLNGGTGTGYASTVTEIRISAAP